MSIAPGNLTADRLIAAQLKRLGWKERAVDNIRHAHSLAYMGKNANDPDIPHRNELPPRDEPLYKDPAPRIDMFDPMQKIVEWKKKAAANQTLAIALHRIR